MSDLPNQTNGIPDRADPDEATGPTTQDPGALLERARQDRVRRLARVETISLAALLVATVVVGLLILLDGGRVPVVLMAPIGLCWLVVLARSVPLGRGR